MLKFILITIGILWLLSKALKYLFRFLLIFTGKQVQKEMERQAQYHQQTQQQTQSGGTRIIYQNDNPNKKHQKDEGEYVDFEEVE